MKCANLTLIGKELLVREDHRGYGVIHQWHFQRGSKIRSGVVNAEI